MAGEAFDGGRIFKGHFYPAYIPSTTNDQGDGDEEFERERITLTTRRAGVRPPLTYAVRKFLKSGAAGLRSAGYRDAGGGEIGQGGGETITLNSSLLIRRLHQFPRDEQVAAFVSIIADPSGHLGNPCHPPRRQRPSRNHGRCRIGSLLGNCLHFKKERGRIRHLHRLWRTPEANPGSAATQAT